MHLPEPQSCALSGGYCTSRRCCPSSHCHWWTVASIDDVSNRAVDTFAATVSQKLKKQPSEIPTF
jgi:hypothetical protein